MRKSASFDFEDILKALRRGGLEKGNIVWVFSSLGFLGRPKGAKNIEEICQIFYKAIKEAVGEEGTIIVPTYSYTIGRNLASEPAVFDPEKEPARIGPFPEFFRKLKGVIRSEDPMMPIAGEGKYAEEILKEVPPNSYGHDSVYERLLYYENAKILTLGLGPNWIPFIHYIDWLVKAPFRFDKLFYGAVKDKYISWIYPVRTLIEESYPWAYRAGELAKEKGICKFSPLGKSGLYVCDYQKYLLLTYEETKKNKWFLSKVGKAIDVIEKEKERLKEKEKIIKFSSDDFKEWLEKIYRERREAVSFSSTAVLKAIKEYFPIFEMGEIPTGEYCKFGHIVPERWSIYKASLKNWETDEEIVSLEKDPAVVYSYSKPFKGIISKERLLKHIKIYPDNKVRQVISTLYDRDFGLSLSAEEYSRLKGNKFYVEIDSDFSYGLLHWLEAKIEGKSSSSLLLVASIEGPYKVNENLSGLFTLLELLKALKGKTPIYTLYLLIIPSEVGLACFLKKHSSLISHLKAIVFLNSLGKENIYAVQTYNLKNEFTSQLLGFLEEKKLPFYARPFINNPLNWGGNPFLYYPHTEELKEKMRDLKEKFNIVPREDFLCEKNELYEILHKSLVFSSTLPPRAFFEPFRGIGTSADNTLEWEKIYKATEILLNVLLTNYHSP